MTENVYFVCLFTNLWENVTFETKFTLYCHSINSIVTNIMDSKQDANNNNNNNNNNNFPRSGNTGLMTSVG